VHSVALFDGLMRPGGQLTQTVALVVNPYPSESLAESVLYDAAGQVSQLSEPAVLTFPEGQDKQLASLTAPASAR